jgi:hypothetical protein
MRNTRKFLYAVPALAIMGVAACNADRTVDPASALLGKGGCPGKDACVINDNANPRYLYSDYSATATSLSNSIKQVGLGGFSGAIDYVLSADYVATYNCKNKPGNTFPTSVPWHREYHFPSTPFSVTPTNGQVTATFTLAVPDPNTDPNAPECGDGPAARQWSWILDESQPAGWSNIKFCWGQETTTQGPVPGGFPSSAADYTMVSGQNATGGPLDGDPETFTGIFASSCLAAGVQ